MISERTLRQWRKDALKAHLDIKGWDNEGESTSERRELYERILRLTQELLDLHLIRKG
uniref:Uncharacterized protein n=1 Tax=viral metagenome TaxID=1070528 RepID=A0A6M3LP91_9ZZZZ